MQVKPTPEQVAAVLLGVTARGPAAWGEIVAAIEKKYVVINWLTEVRGPLQWLLNTRQLARKPSVYVEVYYRVKGE